MFDVRARAGQPTDCSITMLAGLSDDIDTVVAQIADDGGFNLTNLVNGEDEYKQRILSQVEDDIMKVQLHHDKPKHR